MSEPTMLHIGIQLAENGSVMTVHRTTQGRREFVEKRVYSQAEVMLLRLRDLLQTHHRTEREEQDAGPEIA